MVTQNDKKGKQELTNPVSFWTEVAKQHDAILMTSCWGYK